MELRDSALKALCQHTWQAKAQWLEQLNAQTTLDAEREFLTPAGIPGRPTVEVVPPAQLGLRSVHTQEGRAILIHALAHIEFNAINLALDVIWRFAKMPAQFYYDWLRVAQEECEHFRLLEEHLKTLGYQYGDFSGHDGLWGMAERTEGDALARLALVPRTLEARGLDASPAVRHKLASGGDPAGAAIIDIILRDEIGHVAVGNRWYQWLCEQRDLPLAATFKALSERYGQSLPRAPFNLEARLAAGFSSDELAAWAEPRPDLRIV
jgi:uncharacterized ferritin-like protein (DUF455 family)